MNTDLYIISVLVIPAAMLFAEGVCLWSLAAAVRRDASRRNPSWLVTQARIAAGLTLLFACPPLLLPAALAFENDGNELRAPIMAIGLIIAGSLAATALFLWRYSLALRDEHDDTNRHETWTFFDVFLRFFMVGPLSALFTSVRSMEHGTAIAGLLGWWMLTGSAILFSAAAVPVPILFVLILVCSGSLLVVTACSQLMGSWARWFHERHWTLWQVYLAIRSRRPLRDELELLSEFAWGRRRRLLREMAEDVDEGVDAVDLLVHPAIISSLEGAQIANGLKTSRLPEALRDMVRRQAAFADGVSRSKNPIISVLYLWAQLLTLCAVVSFISYWIMPKFKKIFADFGMAIPDATIVMIKLTDEFIHYWYVGFPLIISLGVAVSLVLLLPFVTAETRFRERLSRIWPRLCLPDILRSLSLAVDAKLPLEEALQSFVRRQLPRSLHNRLVRVQEAVRDGRDCWQEMRVQRLLTTAEAALLKSAEAADNLPWALAAIGDRCEQRQQFRWLFAGEFLHPVVTILLSLFVGAFAVACFLPLVRMISAYS